MRIPSVTDEMLDKVMEQAASPLFVLFQEAGVTECDVARRICELAADEYDDRVIFLRLVVDENPVIAERLGVRAVPQIVVWKGHRELARRAIAVSARIVAELLEEVCRAV